MEYHDLQDLLHHSADAQSFFDSLPDYAREQLSQHREHFHTLANLREYAQNLRRNDL